MPTIHTTTEPAIAGTTHHRIEPGGFGVLPFGDPSNYSDAEIKAHMKGFGDPKTRHTTNNEV